MKMKIKTIRNLLIGLVLAMPLLACPEEEGPLEKAGERIDEAVEDAGDAVEEAGDAVEDAADELDN